MRAPRIFQARHATTAVHRAGCDGPSCFSIRAQGFIQASQQQAWQVLTGYERLPDFVPHLLVSRVVSRTGDEVLMEQETRTGFLFVSRAIRMLVRVTERPQHCIRAALVSGDMRRYEAEWELEAASRDGESGTHITYSGKLEPEFFIPPLMGEALVRKDVEQMVEAVLREIERRQRMQ